MRKLSVALVVALACLTCFTAVAGARPTTAKHSTKGDTGNSSSPLFTGAVEGDEYPPCGPYVSEGTTQICHLDEVSWHAEENCEFQVSSGYCRGGLSGLFPWGTTGAGGDPSGDLRWQTTSAGREVIVTTKDSDRKSVVAQLAGSIPGASSERFTVTDAYARSDRGFPRDHFWTPDFPGQAAGEVGGPLKFTRGIYKGYYLERKISGFLFLR